MPNPSLKRSANGRPPGPVWRYAVHFRQPGPSHPAAGGRLARTLGIREQQLRYASRVSAFRRELNSHDAAQPQCIRRRRASDQEQPHVVAPRRALKSSLAAQAQADHEPELEEAAVLRLASNLGLPLLRWISAAIRPAKSYQAGAGTVGDRQRRTGKAVGCRCGRQRRRGVSSRHLSSRRAEGRVRPVCSPRALMPNPSLKRSANGRPPAPGRWYAVHFHRPGAGVLPSSPA